MKIHFIGIGGIGVSALARYYLAQGFLVSGSDVAESEIVDELRALGANVTFNPPNPPLQGGQNPPPPSFTKEGVDLVIYSAAVEENNPELVEARRRGIKCQTYAQALGELTKKYFTIAVSGTHGKSTTTAMIGLILEAAGLDPTVIVGTKVKWGSADAKIPPNPSRIKFGTSSFIKGGETEVPFSKRGEKESNFRLGNGKYLVIEADEYAASFLNYWPKIIVLTNIEEDHLDYYTAGLPQIIETFAEYVSHLGKDGVLVANGEDDNISKIKNQKSKLQCKIQNYNSKIGINGLKLKVPGRHNLSNAAAAITAARILGIADRITVKTLNNFTGTWRRMEYKGKVNGAKIYDDYGHHPTEIKTTLAGARELLSPSLLKRGIQGDLNPSQPPFKKGGEHKLWCVFQPHQYQRTYKLFDQFIGSFADADKVILLPIYSVAGREKNEIKKKVSSEMLAEAIKNQKSKIKNQNDNAKCKIIKSQDVVYLDSFEKATEYLKKNLKKGDICVIMGAGDIYKLTERLIYKNPRPRQTCPAQRDERGGKN